MASVSESALSLIGLTGITLLSAVLHESGHIAVAKTLGGKTHGIVWRWYGIGCRLEVSRDEIWLVALGGLTVSAILAVLFLAFTGPLAQYGFTLNALILFTNLVPYHALDGGYVLRHFRMRGEPSA